jgi:RNA polymerase sigma-70 factor (ECF subfamily)
MCHNDADALDLTQSTFLKALEALPRFEHRARFYTWVFRIAVNLTLSHRRKQGRRRTHSLERPAGQRDGDVEPTVPARQEDVSEGLEQSELRDRLARALDQLDDEFRVAVVLKDIEHMDYAAIAEVLDVPVGTVKSRIHRGRMALRELLGDERKPVDAA